MKRNLHYFAGLLLAVGSLLTPAKAFAVTEQADYSETFEGITDASAADFAPNMWLHFVHRGSSTDAWYVAETSGGHDGGAYIATTDKCNPYYATDDCLVTPPVKGSVSFWVKGKTLELYTMTFDGAKITKGSSIKVPTGFTINETDWQKVTLDIADYTRIGILFRSKPGGLDDFTAEFVDASPLVYTTLSDITFDAAPVADVDGNAIINVSFNFNNKGTDDVDLTNATFTFGKVNFLDNLISEYATLPSNAGKLAPGESKKLSFEVPYKLANPSVTESSISLGVRNSFNGATTKVGTVKVISKAGIFELYNGTTKIEADKYVECDYHKGAYTLTLGGSNTGESDIVITDIEMDGTLEDAVTPVTLPFTLAKGADKEGMTFTFDATPGAKTGNVTLTYSDGISDDCTFTFSLGCGTVAEDGLIEDFEEQKGSASNSMPNGWRVESGQFLRTTYGSYDFRYRANSDVNNESTLVTSLMKIEKGGQLTLMGGRTAVSASHDKVLVIYLSKDRETWIELGGVVASLGSGRAPFNTFEAPATANEMRWYNFSFKNVESGNYYIKFVAHPFSLDNIYGVTPVDPGHDFILESISAPSAGEVNKLLTAKVEISNMRGESDDAYTVTLYDGETAVANAEGVAIDAYSKETIELSYMPRTKGEATLHAVVVVDEGAENAKTLTSSDVTVNVAEEECVGKAEASIDGYDSNILLNYRFNKVQFFIPAEEITIPAGKEINEIEFSVYNSSSYSNVTMPYSLWIEEVDEVAPFTDADKVDFELPDEALATTGTYTLEAGVSSAAAPAKCILPLAKPLAYTGKSLKITMQMNLASMASGFNVGVHNYNEQLYRMAYRFTETGSASYVLKTSAPAVHLRYALEPSRVTGRIIKKGEAQSGVKVVLTEKSEVNAVRAKVAVSQDAAKVTYSDVTGTDGSFSIPVIKNDRAYELTAEMPDGTYVHPTLLHPTDHVALNDVDVTPVPTGIDAVEANDAVITVTGSSVKVDGADAEVYSLNGVKVGTALDGEALKLVKGVYIVRIAGTSVAHKIVIR